MVASLGHWLLQEEHVLLMAELFSSWSSINISLASQIASSANSGSSVIYLKHNCDNRNWTAASYSIGVISPPRVSLLCNCGQSGNFTQHLGVVLAPALIFRHYLLVSLETFGDKQHNPLQALDLDPHHSTCRFYIFRYPPPSQNRHPLILVTIEVRKEKVANYKVWSGAVYEVDFFFFFTSLLSWFLKMYISKCTCFSKVIFKKCMKWIWWELERAFPHHS